MATPEFKFPVEAQGTGNQKPLIREAQFGDGYVQSSGDGINTSFLNWEISYSGKLKQCEQVLAFFRERAGYQSFVWKDPTGKYGLYKSKEWNILPIAKDVFKVTTTFEQSFKP